MLLKFDVPDVAEQLVALGFSYVTETVNKKTFYCFEQSPELTKVIMDKFADVRLVVDDHLRF